MQLRELSKRAIRRNLRRLGFDVQRYRPQQPLLLRLCELYGVDCVFDVGANTGSMAAFYRSIGFRGRIVSFEPVSHLFEALQERARGDADWLTERMALGATNGETTIHVSGDNGGASSVLEMTRHVVEHAPQQRVVRVETVPLCTLGAAVQRHYPHGRRLFVKLDVQGYEHTILAAASDALDSVVALQAEMSLVRCYDGELLLHELLPWLYQHGFRLVRFENAWTKLATQEAFQVDGLFVRTDRVLC